jgi:hypothetical protein
MEITNFEKIFKIKIDETSLNFINLNLKSKQVYSLFLAQTYYFVKHTTAMLAKIISKSSMYEQNDFKDKLSHFKEELGHESLLLSDLKNLGMDIKQFKEYPETRLLYQSQFYCIEKNIDSHMGYSLYLEGLGAFLGPKILENLINTWGEKSVSFIKTHGIADQKHFTDGVISLEKLSNATKLQVLENLEQTNLLYNSLIKRIYNETSEGPTFAASVA